MEIKDFKKTIEHVLIEYGFRKINKYYYLDSNGISLVTFLNSRYGSYVLSYNFSLHEIHSENERQVGDPFNGYDSLLIDTISAKGVKFLSPKDVTFDELTKDISERVQRYFSPLIKDFKNHILNEIKEKNNGDEIVLLKDIKKYFGITI